MQSPRKPLYERSESETNTRAGVRLVPQTPPRLQLQRSNDDQDDIYSRNLLAASPSQILLPARDGASSTQLGLALTAQAVSDESVKHLLHPGSKASTTHKPLPSNQSQSSASSSKPLSQKRKHVKVNPDKTFSVLLEPTPQREVPSSGIKSATSEAIQIAHDHLASDRRNIVDAVDFPASDLARISNSTLQNTPRLLRSRSDISADKTTDNSPGDYKLVGGLRKVAKTPDLKQKAALTSDPPLPQLETTYNPRQELNPKPSFLSTETTSTTASEKSNYKVYNSSPTSRYTSIPPPSSSNSKYQILTQSSPASQVADSFTAPPSSSDSNYQILGQSSPDSSEVDLPSENYQLHGNPSSSPSYAAPNSTSYASYSQESLVLPPLRPRSQRNAARFGHFKSQSGDSLRTGSLTSISSVLSQDVAKAIAFQTTAGSGSIIRIQSSNYTSSSGSWADRLRSNSAKPLMQSHPHQWSSQLSTVASVSDAGTDPNTRSLSDGNGRRSSGFPSVHSRQMPSISSSLHQQEAYTDPDHLQIPQPSFARNRDGTGSTIRMVEDRDEDGDGITDMLDLSRLPYRRNMYESFGTSSSDNNGRTSTMQSSTSSRANSLTAASIPVWARLYYGSGERRFLGPTGSSSDLSQSRPPSSRRSGSPDATNFPSNIYSPRRRPRARDADARTPYFPQDRGSMEISSVPRLRNDDHLIRNKFARRHRRPSSVWSPHLHSDNRATTRHSMWEPPSVEWSDTGLGSKRNIQVVMFIAGFILPFAWMIASFLPLPPNPIFDMRERQHTSDDLEMPVDLARHLRPLDAKRYESARWWRTLNRIMAVAGLAIVILIVVLVLVSVRSRWAS